jgi:hypothetical protein
MGRFAVIKNSFVKIEQVIVLHLLHNKQVSLQGIGTFKLDPSVSLPADTDKDFVIPENAVSFEYNPRAKEDESLINSIVQHTSKIKPLAASDLESFLMLNNQFLNIGKPFKIDKLGTLEKAQGGELKFVPGQYIIAKIEAPKTLKEDENEESSGLFNDYNKRSNNGSKVLITVVTIGVLALIGWAIYYFIFSKKPGPEGQPLTQQVNDAVDSSALTDTTTKSIIAPSIMDTLKKDSLATDTLNPANSSAFKVVFRQTTNRMEAQTTMTRLNKWGHHIIMYTNDSVNFKLAEVVKRPLSDTTRVKDSLEKFYGGAVSVELNNF